MSTDSKKHHFVPRSILKNFQDEKNRLFVFDKVNAKSFVSNADNAGHENNFNSFNIGSLKINFENVFQDIDSELDKLVKKVKFMSRVFKFTQDELYKLSYIICVQQIRTKESRTTLCDFSKSIHEWINEMNLKGGISANQIKNIPILNENDSKLIALSGLDNIEEIVALLLSKGIVLFKTSADYPFWISDNPVVMDNLFPYGRLGLKVQGTDVYFPITKEFTIGFICRTTCDKIYENYWILNSSKQTIPENFKKLFDGIYRNKVIEINRENVDYFNSLQVQNSSRFIYGSLNEFSIAKDMINETPELKEIKGRLGIMRGAREYNKMPNGEYVVFFFENDHFMVPVQLEADKYDLTFYSSDKYLHKIFITKKQIECVEVFKDKKQIKIIREVIISDYDITTNKITIKHKDEGLQKIIQDLKSRK